MSIVKNIHQIWFQGFGQLPDKYKSNIDSVRRLNTDWTHYQWDDNKIRYILNTYFPSQYIQKYDSFKYLHQKIDFGRYAILYVYGGASIDVDVVAIRSLNEVPDIDTSDFIVSYNASNRIENLVKAGRVEMLNNATILVSRNNPILKKLLEHILTLRCDENQSKYSCISDTTGVNEFTDFILPYKDQIKILDNKFFEPCSGSDASCEIPQTAILDHQHEGTWVDDNYKTIARIYYHCKKYKWAFFIVALLLLFLLLCRMFK